METWLPTLVVAILGLFGVVISTRTWPTLGRRIRDHTALTKDLPPELSADLRALLTDEIGELIRRDRRRLDPWLNRYSNALRALGLAALTLVASIVLTFPALSVLFADAQIPEEEVREGMLANLAALGGGAGVAGAALLVARKRRERRVRADLDRAQESALGAIQKSALRLKQDAARRAAGLPPLGPDPSLLPPVPPGRRPRPSRVAGQRHTRDPQPGT